MRREVFESLRVYLINGICIGFILFIVLRDIAHAAFLQLLECKEPPFDGVEAQKISQISWKYHDLTPHTRLLRPSTNFSPILQCILHSSYVVDTGREDHFPWPQILVPKLNISNYTILDTFKLHSRRIWPFPGCPDALNPLSFMHSTLLMIQSKTWTHFPTLDTLKTLLTWRLNHGLLWSGWKHSSVPLLHWALTLLRDTQW